MGNFSHFTKEPVDLQDNYPFECQKCGKCCKHRNDVLLNGRDVWALAGLFRISTEEFIKKYCLVYIGKSSRIPVVTLRPVGKALICPFLHENLCLVQEAKPTVCLLYPLGRMIRNEMLKEGEFKNPKVEYFEQSCRREIENPDEKKKAPAWWEEENEHTVEAWLKRMGVEHPDSFFVSWTNMICRLCIKVIRLEKETPPGTIHRVWDLLFSAMYLWYKPDSPFEEQFVANMIIIDEFVKQVEEECSKYHN